MSQTKYSTERRKIIKDSLGYEPDFNKISDNYGTYWLKDLNIRKKLLTQEKGKSYADDDTLLRHPFCINHHGSEFFQHAKQCSLFSRHWPLHCDAPLHDERYASWREEGP